MMMRLFAATPRDEVLSVAHRLYGDGRLVSEDRVDSQALTHVIGALSWCDDYRAADDALALTLSDARRRGSTLTSAMACQLRARQRLWTGPIAEAVADARSAVEVWHGGAQAYLHPSSHCLVGGLLELGDLEAADAVLALGDGQAPASGFFAAWRHAATGRVAAARGRDEEALAAFLLAGRRLVELDMVNPTVIAWRSEAALAARRLGRDEQAGALAAEELALAERFGAARALGVARRACGLLERGEAAVATLRSAVEVLGGSGARVEHARAAIDLGAAIRRAGRPREARDALRAGVALADAAGATSLAQRARDELRRAGGRARETAGGAAARLTPSELRVAELAAAGAGNRQIAATLFVTTKSVEWHLGNVYRKLDIRGRGELAGALGEPESPATP